MMPPIESWSQAAPWLTLLLVILLAGGLLLWQRHQAQRRLIERIRELETLSAAGRTIAGSQLDVAALCSLVARLAGQLIDTSTFQIGLFDGPTYNILHWTINGIPQPTPRSFHLTDGQSGLIGWIRDSKQPLLVRDFEEELSRLPARPRYVSPSPPRSAIFIPLLSSDRTIGVMAAQSGEPASFDETDMRRLLILSNQAAAAIQNARLYEQERSRAAQLELVMQIAQQVNQIYDLDELFDTVAELTRETFGFHPVNIFGVDPQTGTAIIEASTFETLAPGSLVLNEGEGLVGMAVATGRMMLASDTATDQRYLANTGSPEADASGEATRSEIAIPLIVDEEILGVFDVHSARPGAFGEAEQMVLEALAAAVAAAMYKTFQLTIQREQAWMTTAQLQMAEAFSQSEDLESLLTVATYLTVMLIGVPECAVLVWDEEMGVYRPGASYGLSAPAAESLGGMTLTPDRWPLLESVHEGQQMRTAESSPPWQQQSAVSATLVPLVASGRQLGVLYVRDLYHLQDATDPELLDSTPTRRAELLMAVSSRLAQAVESAQLRVAQQEEAWVNTALLQVAEAVNSLIDLDEILDSIVRFVPLLAGVSSALIVVRDEESDCFRTEASFGLSEMGRGLAESLEIRPDELSLLAEWHEGALTPSSSYFRIQLPRWLEKIFGTPEAHAFPLIARNRMVGVLLVGPSTNNRPLSGRRLSILTGIAHQAATAVVNHELYEEASERDRLEQELEFARRIQSSLLPQEAPLMPGLNVASFWQAARQVSGDFYDFFGFANGDWGVVVADVADKGVPAALFMTLSRTILRTVAFSRGAPAETLMRANTIICNDSQSDLFVTVFYAVWHAPTQTLTYAGAGHNPPLLLRRNGKSTLLQPTGMALGVLQQIEMAQHSIKIQEGDILILYTDGVTEAVNEDYDEFGLRRLRLAAEGARHLSAAHIVEEITSAIRDHAGDRAQFDDITLVVLKRET